MTIEKCNIGDMQQRAPISNVRWLSRDSLKPNDYNPNKVAPPELELLIVSILEDGWTQPIVILPDNTIVDGFHRYTVSGDKRLIARFGDMVPTVTVDIDPVHRQMSTIRHNRARGTHGILPMAHIVRNIFNEGISKEEIQARLGMEDEEVNRLIDRSGMPQQSEKHQQGFVNSWKPKANN